MVFLYFFNEQNFNYILNMKTFFRLLLIFLVIFAFSSCAESKIIEIDGKKVNVEPYGWFDSSVKNDSVHYQLSKGNIIWSVILSETIVAPILITGTGLYEPVKKLE